MGRSRFNGCAASGTTTPTARRNAPFAEGSGAAGHAGPKDAQPEEFNREVPDVHPLEDRGPESRRQVLETAQRCCLAAVRPSEVGGGTATAPTADRLADQREAQRRKTLELLNTIDIAVQQLRSALQD
jgi:hypothetical protein